jgi:hypothetical protein
MSGGSPLRQRYRLEFLDAVRTTKPVYVIVGPMTTAFLGSERDLQSFPEFWTLMQQCYELETAIGALTAYRIRGCRV